MKAISLSVYDKNLEFLGMIDDFISLRWRRKYFETGEYELHLSMEKNIQKFLKEDNIIVREDAIEAGIIESIQITDDSNNTTVKIMGRFLTSILDRRIIKEVINFKGRFLDGERKLLSEMSPFNKLIIKPTDILTDEVIFQCTYKNVYTYLNKLAKSSNVAHRILPDLQNKTFVYENYQGLDRTETQNVNTRYEFSEDKSNLSTADYAFSSKSKKNYVLVGGEGEGTNRKLVTVKNGEHTDFDLRETFVNASQERKDDNITDSDYQEILINKGKENLLDSTENIEVDTFTDDYKNGWDLGDIVNVKKESWNISMKKRITEVEEVFENENFSISVVLGTPLAETFQDDDKD